MQAFTNPILCICYTETFCLKLLHISSSTYLILRYTYIKSLKFKKAKKVSKTFASYFLKTFANAHSENICKHFLQKHFPMHILKTYAYARDQNFSWKYKTWYMYARKNAKTFIYVCKHLKLFNAQLGYTYAQSQTHLPNAHFSLIRIILIFFTLFLQSPSKRRLL